MAILDRVKSVARRVPGIDAILAQRDQLVAENAMLREENAVLRSRPTGAELDRLAEHHYQGEGSRKPLIYLAEYEKLFGTMRNEPLRLLELGVRFGASMGIWADYFPNAIIVGLDIDDQPAAFPNRDQVHFVQGRQDDPEALDRCMAISNGQFDIIIDDCAHIGRLAAASFAYLFPRALRPGGYYVIEDICTAFLPQFIDSEPYAPRTLGDPFDPRYFLSHQIGMVGVVKQLFDHVMAPTALGSYTVYPIERMTVLTNIAIMQKATLPQ